jgi:hypothetical protein
MQSNQQPSRWALVGAQLLAYFVTVLIILVVFFFLWTPVLAGLTNQAVIWGVLSILALLSGALLAAIQRSALRKWLASNRLRVIASGIALPVLVFATYGLFAGFILPPPASNWFGLDYYHMNQGSLIIQRWSLLAGFLAGLPGGWVFGMIQSYFLPWRKRTWWVLSAAAWGVIGALVLLALNTLAILKSI